MHPLSDSKDLVTRQMSERKRTERAVSLVALVFESVVKVPLFRCQRCGECILSHTAFICSQRCPKRMRNGPCGGTGLDGSCEVYPDRRCVWHRIAGRARLLRRLPLLQKIEKIHNWDLEKTSAWLNVVNRRIDPPTWFVRKRRER